MIPEKYYSWPAAKALDVYIGLTRLMIIDCDYGILPEEEINEWMYERPVSFIMHHQHIEIIVISLAYGDMDHARKDLIETIMNSSKVFHCMTISDAITNEEYSR